MRAVPPSVPPLPAKRIAAVRAAVAHLYAERPSLNDFPKLVLPLLPGLIASDVAGYGELDPRTGATRGTIDPMLPDWERMHLGYYQHMRSHPFWQIDPILFASGPKRAADVFGKGVLQTLPIFADAFSKVGVTDLLFMGFVFAEVRVGFGLYRLGGKPFSAADRDTFAAFQPHLEQARELAWHRTVSTLPMEDRVALLHPHITGRQRDVLTCLASGKDNATMARILGIGVNAVKIHLKAVFAALKVETRLEAALTLFDTRRLHVPAANMTVGSVGKSPRARLP